ncbi:MAG: hypothetical protein LC708_03270, partial [Actinobacteria bacterium]|nr:hypothetical protein [Actinomycetota bacterium]
ACIDQKLLGQTGNDGDCRGETPRSAAALRASRPDDDLPASFKKLLEEGGKRPLSGSPGDAPPLETNAPPQDAPKPESVPQPDSGSQPGPTPQPDSGGGGQGQSGSAGDGGGIPVPLPGLPPVLDGGDKGSSGDQGSRSDGLSTGELTEDLLELLPGAPGSGGSR